MQINGVFIENTFAEAFSMKATRLTVTAINEKWAMEAAKAATGFSTSVIGCGVEAGIEGKSQHTADCRPGVDCLFFASGKSDLIKNVSNRVGQAVMTTPTSACYDGDLPEVPMNFEGLKKYEIGKSLRFFGDGYQASKVIGGIRYWRVPVMDGEFLIQEEFTMIKAIGGGNFLILAKTVEDGLAAAEAAVEAMRELRGVIMPFPGGVVRSGSKVGSKYKFLSASTNTAYCPTICKVAPESEICGKETGCVMELVIDGLTEDLVGEAMRTGILAACAMPGVQKITAGNYGGKLGKFNFHLHQLLKK